MIQEVGCGARRLRYNTKLRCEYEQVVRQYRNDAIELFFAVLADSALFVPRNNLSRQDYATARDRCRWPGHDQHLLAAALGGDDPTIFVTEECHARCAPCILARFGTRVERLA